MTEEQSQTLPGEPPPANEPENDALRHLGVVAATVIGLAILTYVVPPLAVFRPWTEKWPLETLVAASDTLPGFAGVGGDSQSIASDAPETAPGLPESNTGELTPPPPPSPETGVSIDPREYAGVTQRIEDPEGRGMRPFYEALLRTARQEDTAMTRISHYGDSSIATDLITYTARRNLQRRFGDGGHGFVLAARGYLPYRHRDVRHDSSNWSIREITRNHEPSGYYGFGGVQARGRRGAWSRFSTDDRGPVGGSVSHFEIWHQAHRRGGQIWYKIDAGSRQVIETRNAETEDRIHRIDVEPGAHRIRVLFGGHGQPRVYGVVLETDGPGVVYDSIGLVGARANRLLNFDADHIAGQLRMRQTNLLVLGFGGNEASDNIQRDSYQQNYARVLERMHGGREDLGCLVFAPLDQAHRDRGRVVTLENLPDIVFAQRQAALAAGCAFFDTWQAMGGEGAMGRWLRARPRLAMSDLRHATPAGYEVIGNLFYKALLAGFADYLAAVERGDIPAPDAPEVIEVPAPNVPSVQPPVESDAGTSERTDNGDAGVQTDEQLRERRGSRSGR